MPFTQNLFPSTLLFGTPGGPGSGSGKKKPKTPTLKVKRRVIDERYGQLIDELYGSG